MLQINPYHLYWLGGEVEKIRLLNIWTGKMDELQGAFLLKMFQISLQQMLRQDEVLLPGCRFQASALLGEIDNVFSKVQEGEVNKLPDLSRFNDAFEKFRKFLEVGLNHVDLFQLQHRGMHDPKRLLFSAQSSFSDLHWKSLSPTAQRDWVSASECLAYGVATACGFHSLRALEAVALVYLKALSVTPIRRDLGHYLELLKQNGAQPKAIEAADQLRSLHRNPLMHPEDFLEEEEATDVYDLCKCAIRALMNDMQKRSLIS